MKETQRDNKVGTMPKLLLEFRRDFVLEDALRHASKAKFDPNRQLKVSSLLFNNNYSDQYEKMYRWFSLERKGKILGV